VSTWLVENYELGVTGESERESYSLPFAGRQIADESPSQLDGPQGLGDFLVFELNSFCAEADVRRSWKPGDWANAASDSV